MNKQIFAIAAIVIVGSTAIYSCKKDTTTTPETQAQTSSVKKRGFTNMEHDGGKKMRFYPDKAKDCIDKSGNCHPEDIVINGTMEASLNEAISLGGYGVSRLFSDNKTAVAYIPDWNTAWFADVKTAILSGSYTFLKVEGTSVYLLGKAGVVNTNSFDYVISYKVR